MFSGCMQNWWKKYSALNPPARWVIQFMLLALSLSFIFAPELKAPALEEEPRFDTRSDSRLYFHNVRSFYYNIDARSKAPMIIYRLKRRSAQRDSVNLSFDLIQAPQSEQAFLFAQLGAGFGKLAHGLIAFGDELSPEPLQKMNSEDHYRLGLKVYQQLQKEEAIWLLNASDTVAALYADPAARLDAVTVLEDFFRLTRKN